MPAQRVSVIAVRGCQQLAEHCYAPATCEEKAAMGPDWNSGCAFFFFCLFMLAVFLALVFCLTCSEVQEQMLMLGLGIFALTIVAGLLWYPLALKKNYNHIGWDIAFC